MKRFTIIFIARRNERTVTMAVVAITISTTNDNNATITIPTSTRPHDSDHGTATCRDLSFKLLS